MAKLHILNEPSKGQSYDLERDTLYVGRSAESDIQVKDKFVSRKHLKILKKGNKYFIEDLRSTNGTFVNGKKIRPGIQYEITEGLPIAIGMSVICLGEVYPEDILAFLDSVDASKDIPKKFGLSIKDRRLTPQKNMEFIYRVSNVLMESLDLQEISKKLLNYLFHLLKRIDRAVIILIDNKTGKISDVISKSKKPSARGSEIYSREVVDRVIQEGKSVMIPDAEDVEDGEVLETLKLMKIGSAMCVPLISRSQMLGVIYVHSLKKPYGFRKEDLSLLTAFSSRAALAIENALLYAALEKRGEAKRKSLEKGQKKVGEKKARPKGKHDTMRSGKTDIP